MLQIVTAVLVLKGELIASLLGASRRRLACRRVRNLHRAGIGFLGCPFSSLEDTLRGLERFRRLRSTLPAYNLLAYLFENLMTSSII